MLSLLRNDADFFNKKWHSVEQVFVLLHLNTQKDTSSSIKTYIAFRFMNTNENIFRFTKCRFIHFALGALFSLGICSAVNVLDSQQNSNVLDSQPVACEQKSESYIQARTDAFLTAATIGNINMLRQLMMSGADGSCVSAFDETALHRAAAGGHEVCVQELIQKTPECINAVSSLGTTPLSEAAAHGHIECMPLLVEAGADVNIGNPLAMAEKNGQIESIRFLLSTGLIDLNQVAEDGDSALSIVQENNKDTRVQTL